MDRRNDPDRPISWQAVTLWGLVILSVDLFILLACLFPPPQVP